MNAMCPVSFQKINENVVRLTSGFAAAAILLVLFGPWQWLILIVAADFFIRGFWEPKYSLFASISTTILALLKVRPVLVDAAPKIFAARTGFLFSCLLLAAWLLNLGTAAMIIGLIFTACALLEAVFKFCVACMVYPLVCKMTAGG